MAKDVIQQKKLRVGWFTFTCCEDSTIVMTELMNDHWQDWKKYIDFRHARVLQSNNVLDKMDVAFVEGAISSVDQVKKLKEIRDMATKLIAIGACAIVGMPSSQRNQFDEKTKEEIKYLLIRFHQAEKVQSLKELVKVDAQVPGCPMNPNKFMDLINSLLKEFDIV